MDRQSEQPTVTTKAVVMIYDDTSKSWVQAGVTEGPSKVQIYHHAGQNTFRVVGRKIQDHEVVVNSCILKGLKYNQATPTFHQWRDRQQVYGLSFMSVEDADSFGQAMQCALDALNASGVPSTPQTSGLRSHPHFAGHGTAQENGSEMDASYDDQRNSSGSSQFGGRTVVPAPAMKTPVVQPIKQQTPLQKPPGIPPQPPPGIPPQPPPVSAPPMPPPGAPPAPSVPISTGGAPPPPPPPPPPPAAGGGFGAKAVSASASGTSDAGGPPLDGLAAALAGAKLKKVAQVNEGAREDSDSCNASGSGGGGRSNAAPVSGGGDMMSEMARRLQARKAKAETSDSIEAQIAQSSSESAKPKPKVTFGSSNFPPPSASTDSLKKPFGGGSPSIGRKVQPAVTGGSGTSDASPAVQSQDAQKDGSRSEELNAMKLEIIAELRKEMHKIKDEIIDALRDQLSNR